MPKNAGESGLSGGTGGSPNQQNSSGADDKQTSSGESVTLETILERLNTIEGQVRHFQGDEDRATNRALEGIAKLEEKFGTLEMQKYSELKASGKSDAEALREIQIDRLLNIEPEAPSQTKTGTQQSETSSDELGKFFGEFEIDINGPKAIEFIKAGKFDDVSKTKFILENSSNSTKMGGTPLPDGTGGTSKRAEDRASLTAELQELQKGNLTDPKNMARRAELNAKLRALN